MFFEGIKINKKCNSDLSISLQACGMGLVGGRFVHGPKKREENIVHLLIKGRGYLETPDGIFHFKEGDVFCTYSNDTIKYYSDGTKWHFAFINFVGTEAEKLYESIGITRNNPIVHVKNSTSFINVVNQCLNYLKTNDIPSQMRLNAYLFEALSYIENTRGKSNVKLKDTCVAKGLEFMENYYNTGISVDSVTNAIGVERSYFYRLFKSQVGVSPIDYLTTLRINRSKALIESGIDLKTVAASVGINDIYYFSKLFKKTEGLTPSAYRKKFMDEEYNI